MRCDKSVSHKKECCNSAKEHSVTLPTKENYIVPPNTASHVYSNTGYWTGKLHFSQDGGGVLFLQRHGSWCVNWPGYEASAMKKKIQL